MLRHVDHLHPHHPHAHAQQPQSLHLHPGSSSASSSLASSSSSSSASYSSSSSSSSTSSNSFFPFLLPKCEPMEHLEGNNGNYGSNNGFSKFNGFNEFNNGFNEFNNGFNIPPGPHQYSSPQFAGHAFPSPNGDRDSGIESAESAQQKPCSDSEWTTMAIKEEEGGMVGDLKGPIMLEMNAEREQGAGGDGGLCCAICGDEATGIHYDVSSCNGCKTFYRRTVMTGRKFVCKRGGNCQFGRDGRCACRACRFRRCIEAGMNEKAIQHTPSANLTLSITRKRFQRLQTELRRGSKALSVSPELLRGFESELLELIGHTLRLEEKLNRLRQSAFSPIEMDLRIWEAVKRPSAFGDTDKWPLVQKWPPRPNPEKVPLAEFIRLGIKFWVYTDLYLGMEYLKTMELFRQLPEAEKIALTKNVILPNQLLSAAHFALQIRSEIIQYPDGLVPFQYKRYDDLLPLEKKIVQGAVPAIQSLRPDQVQVALIRAILLLDENCDGLSPLSREQIGQHRSKLCRVLLIYLQNRHGPEGGLKQFADSMNFISGLFRRQQIQKTYFIYRHYILHNAAPIPLFWDFMDELKEISQQQKMENKNENLN